jgi:hypothetical protein
MLKCKGWGDLAVNGLDCMFGGIGFKGLGLKLWYWLSGKDGAQSEEPMRLKGQVRHWRIMALPGGRLS